jgi:hypothetical protein
MTPQKPPLCGIPSWRRKSESPRGGIRIYKALCRDTLGVINLLVLARLVP